MKLGILSVLLLFSAVSVHGQDNVCEFRVDSLSKATIYTTYDQAPTFGKSHQATLKYIGEQFKIPSTFSGREIIVASIIVSENGEVTDIRLVQKSENSSVNKNYIKVLESMKKWHPAMCDGKAVRAELILPIRVQLGYN